VQIYDMLRNKIDMGLVKCVVLGGPGSAKRDFNDWCQKRAMQAGDSDIVKQKGIFVCVDATSIHNQGLAEILGDPQVQKRVANTRAALHFKALEEITKRLGNNPEMACYGPKEVKRAYEMGAIDIMMISDALFRNSSLQVRKEYVQLVHDVKESGSTAHVFSSGHVTGQKLAELANIAAILRFQVEFEEAPEHEGEAPAVQTTTETEENSTAPLKSEPARLEREVSASQQKPGVADLLLALGGKVSEARIEQALVSAKGAAEDAYLVLLGQELDGTGKEPVPEAKKEEQKSFAAGDVVEVVQEFGSNSKNVVQLPKGQIGNIVKIDSAGDAYIDFGEGFGKQWIKPRSWCHMTLSKSSFAPPAREAAAAPAKSPASSAKAAAKPAAAKPAGKAPAKAKPATKPKAKKAAMQWDDDYDY